MHPQSAVVRMGFEEVVLELVAAVETLLTPTAAANHRTPEDLVVVFLHAAFELVGSCEFD